MAGMYVFGLSSTVTVEAIVKEKIEGLLNASIKVPNKIKCLKVADPSAATSTAPVHAGINSDSSCEALLLTVGRDLVLKMAHKFRQR